MITFVYHDFELAMNGDVFGDILEVMPPSGNFIMKGDKNHIVGICAGSGVTPIFSMIKSKMENSKGSVVL